MEILKALNGIIYNWIAQFKPIILMPRHKSRELLPDGQLLSSYLKSNSVDWNIDSRASTNTHPSPRHIYVKMAAQYYTNSAVTEVQELIHYYEQRLNGRCEPDQRSCLLVLKGVHQSIRPWCTLTHIFRGILKLASLQSGQKFATCLLREKGVSLKCAPLLGRTGDLVRGGLWKEVKM